MEKHETQLNNWRRKYRERNNEKEVKQNWKQTFDRHDRLNSSSLVTNEETRMAALSRAASAYQDGLHP